MGRQNSTEQAPIETSFKSQAKDDAFAAHVTDKANVDSAIAMTQSHIMALESRLAAVGGHAASDRKKGVAAVLGVAASEIDNVRKTEVSKGLRDDYSALCLPSAGYTMLHAAPLGLSDAVYHRAPRSNAADRFRRFVMHRLLEKRPDRVTLRRHCGALRGSFIQTFDAADLPSQTDVKEAGDPA